MNVVVTGARGLLAPYVVDALQPMGPVVALTREDCRLDDADAVRRCLGRLDPGAVVHTAAFTDVDGCQRDPDRALRDNVAATANVADALSPAAYLVVISTDQVYPDTEGPHREPDTGPVNVYGQSKLRAEQAARSHARALVLRTNFFGASRTPGRVSLSDQVVATLARGDTFYGFEDVFFSPLHMTTLAARIHEAVATGLVGTFNLGCQEGTSKAGFARCVARHHGLDETRVLAGSSAAVAGRAPRPRDLRLDVGAYERATGVALPTLLEEVARL